MALNSKPLNSTKGVAKSLISRGNSPKGTHQLSQSASHMTMGYHKKKATKLSQFETCSKFC